MALAKLPIVLLGKPDDRKQVADALASLQKNDTIEKHSAANSDETISLIKQSGAGVVLFEIRDRDYLVEVLKILVGLKPMIASGLLRVIGFSDFGNAKVSDTLMKKGCSEILTGSVTTRALTYKFERFKKLIETSHAKKSDAAADDIEVAKRSAALGESRSAKRFQVELEKPLDLASDCWLLQRPKDAKRIGQKWLVEILGPAPGQGKWEPTSSSSNAFEKEEWEWNPKGKGTEFIPDPGRWVFRGRQPEFRWQALKWEFVSEEPCLEFQWADGQASVSRFKLIDKCLHITRNSSAAKGHLPLIRESLEIEARFLKDQGVPTGKELRIELENEDGPAWGSQLEPEETPDSSGSVSFDREKNEGILRDLRGPDAEPKKHKTIELDLREDSKDPEAWRDGMESIPLVVEISLDGAEFTNGRFLDIFDSTLILEAPEGFGAELGSKLTVRIQSSKSSSKTGELSVELHGTVAQSEFSVTGSHLLTLELERNFATASDRIFEFMSRNQENILKFMRSAKGL